jgi:RimJ/RimL family protein N-acetyltransferase
MITHLETERLVLRQLRASDFDWVAPFMADAATTAFIGGPQSVGDAWRRMVGWAGHWSLYGYGRFILETKSHGQAIGYAGVMFPADFPENELGWGLIKAEQGKGYAREAARCLCDHAKHDLRLPSLVSYTRPGNDASVRVAQAIGGVFEGVIELFGKPCHVYRYFKGTV